MEELVKIKEKVDAALKYVAELDIVISPDSWNKLDLFYNKISRLNGMLEKFEYVESRLERYGVLTKPENLKKLVEGVRLLTPILNKLEELEEDD